MTNTCPANLLKSSLRSCRSIGRTAILATGGIDSTVLAALSKPARPHLVFAAVEDQSRVKYNRASIDACQKVAQILHLRLNVISISSREYFRHFFRLARFLEKPCRDTDLPAAARLMQECRRLGIKTIISGMGSDEIFGLRSRPLKAFVKRYGLPAVELHRTVARLYGIEFHGPFLDQGMLEYGLKTPQAKKTNKSGLLASIQNLPELHGLMCHRSPDHSIIPSSFLAPLQTWLGEKKRPFDRDTLFQKAARAAWKRYHK